MVHLNGPSERNTWPILQHDFLTTSSKKFAWTWALVTLLLMLLRRWSGECKPSFYLVLSACSKIAIWRRYEIFKISFKRVENQEKSVLWRCMFCKSLSSWFWNAHNFAELQDFDKRQVPNEGLHSLRQFSSFQNVLCCIWPKLQLLKSMSRAWAFSASLLIFDMKLLQIIDVHSVTTYILNV